MRNISIKWHLFIALNLIFLIFTSANAAQHHGKQSPKPAEPAPAAEAAPEGPPVVAQVISGDLLQLQSGERLRLMGADAPVMALDGKPGQDPWASESRRFTENLVQGKEIMIKSLGLNVDE